MNSLRPNGQRARNAIAFIWLVLLMDILTLISSGLQYHLLETFALGSEISEEVANANDTREQIIAIIYLVCFIISSVFFILWFRRAYFNLGIIMGKLSYTDGWAAGSWFVPIVCLFQPYLMMKELYTKTRIVLINRSALPSGALKTNTLGWWWALWIISNVLGQLVFRSSRTAETFEELGTYTVISIAESLVNIPLALVTLKVIRDYSKVEYLFFSLEEENLKPIDL